MPSTEVDYTLSNTPPVAIDLAAALTSSAPDAISVGAGLTTTEPTAITLGAALTSDAPDAITLGASLNDAAAVPRAINGIDYATLPALPIMPANFAPAFIELTGGGPSLASLSVSSADLNRIIQGTVSGELKSYQVRAGTDAQALPGIVRPANFNAATNALLFVQL